MLSFTPSANTVKNLIKINRISSEKIHLIDSLPSETMAAMRRYARVSILGATTRIENAVLTDAQINWMDKILSADGRPSAFEKERVYIENKLSKERERSIEEVAGCRDMQAILLEQGPELFPLSESTLLGLSRELLKFYPPAAHYLGRYKIAPNSVVEIVNGSDIRRDVLRTADPGPITSAAMHDLIQWYNDEIKNNPWSIAVASEFVFRFLAIHPFQDGNGRIGRGLFSLALLQGNDGVLSSIIPYIAPDRHIESHRQEYYLALRKCSEGQFHQDPREYHIEYFLTFMLKMLERSVENDVDFYAKKYHDHQMLSDAQREVLHVFEDSPEKKLALRDAMRETEIPKRTAIHALGALAGKGFLQKTGRGPSAKYQIMF